MLKKKVLIFNSNNFFFRVYSSLYSYRECINFQEEKELTDMEVNLHRTRSLLGEKVIRLRHLEQSLQRANVQNDQKHEDATLSDISSHSASSGISSTEFATGENFGKGILNSEKFQESSEIIQSLENLNSEIREIWDVLRTQQQQTNIAQGK